AAGRSIFLSRFQARGHCDGREVTGTSPLQGLIMRLRRPAGRWAQAGALVALALASAHCGNAPSEHNAGEIGAVDLPIWGGSTVATCQWPPAVLLPDPECSGTLVHPLIVTTAAHCIESKSPIKTVVFGEKEQGAREVPVDSCKAYQSANGPDKSDW